MPQPILKPVFADVDTFRENAIRWASKHANCALTYRYLIGGDFQYMIGSLA